MTVERLLLEKYLNKLPRLKSAYNTGRTIFEEEKMSHSTECPKCSGEIRCLGGESAHPDNWYCADEEGCGWQARALETKVPSTLTPEEIEEITEYIHLEGTEISCYLLNVIHIRQYSEPHGMSPEFSKATDRELRHWLDRFRNETEIVTMVEPQPDKVTKELVWYAE